MLLFNSGNLWKASWSTARGEDFGLKDGKEVRHWSKPVQNSKQSGLLAELIDCFKLKGTAGV